MEFDFGRLRRGERIAAIGGVLLFILLFFDWYDVSISTGIAGIGSIGGGISAWDAFDVIDIYLLITALVAVGLAVLTATQRTPALPVTASVVTAAVGAIATLLILYRIIATPGGDLPSSVDVSPTFWAFAGLVAAAGVTYGGYLSMREEGTTLGDVRAQASAAGAQARSAFEGGGSSAAPPPPAPATPPAEAPPESAAEAPTYPSETTYPSESTFPAGPAEEDSTASAPPPPAP
jgi:hypothetical protein